MKSCRNRILALFFCVLLLARTPGGALAESGPDAGQALTGAEQAVLSDWFYFLRYENDQTGYMLWILDHVQKALEEQDWDSLKRAWTVLEHGKLSVSRLKPTRPETTAEQYRTLADRYGADIYAFQDEMTSGLDKQEMLNHIEIIRTNLQAGFCLGSTRDTMKKTLSAMREFYQAHRDYDACASAYFFLLLEGSEDTEKARAAVQRDCPLIDSALSAEDLSSKDLEALGVSAADRQAEAVKTLHHLAGIMENDIALLEEAAETGNLSLLTDDLVPIEGLSSVLPAPEWYWSESTEFTWALSDGDRYRGPEALEELTENPSFFRIRCKDTSALELWLYAEYMDSFGHIGKLVKSGQKVTYTCRGDDWKMSIDWDGETMTADLYGNIPCLAPDWYAELFQTP